MRPLFLSLLVLSLGLPAVACAGNRTPAPQASGSTVGSEPVAAKKEDKVAASGKGTGMNGDMRARCREYFGNGSADAAGGAGYQGAFTAEVDIHG